MSIGLSGERLVISRKPRLDDCRHSSVASSGEEWWLYKRRETPPSIRCSLPLPDYQQSLVSVPVAPLIPVLVSVNVAQSPSADSCAPTGVAVRVKVVPSRTTVTA